MKDQGCWRVVARIALDVVALFLAFLPFILLSLNQSQPFQRGFFCSDETIRYPYRPDSVSAQALFMGTLFISTGIILIVEISRYIHSKCRPTSNETTTYRFSSNCSVPIIVFVLYKVLGGLYFGYVLTMSLVDIGKFSSGRLRPHFIYVCRPDPNSYNCSSSETGQTIYVEKFRCMGTSKLAIWNGRLSFPSGHAALATYVAAFMLVYLQVRLTRKPLRRLRNVLQAACYAAAIYISISRVSDNAHHWSDVLPGFILGNIIGALTILHVCHILRLASKSIEVKKLPSPQSPPTSPQSPPTPSQEMMTIIEASAAAGTNGHRTVVEI